MKKWQQYGYILKEIVKTNKYKKKIMGIPHPIERKEQAFRLVKEAFGRILDKFGIVVQTEGEHHVPKDRPVVFAVNHQGTLDIPVIVKASPVPIGFIAKKEIKRFPIVRDWMQALNCLFIDRTKGKQSIHAIGEWCEQMDEKGSFVIFPEGTRSKGPEMKPFKRAGLSVALSHGATIIPVTINGTYLLMESNENRLKSGRVQVTFHPPFVQLESEKSEESVKRLAAVIGSGLSKNEGRSDG